MAKQNSFTEDALLAKGFTKDAQGNFIPPSNKTIIKISGGKELILSDPLVQKEKVVQTTQFQHKPVTEWFIPYQVPSKKNTQQLYIRRTKEGKSVPATTTSARYKNYIAVTKQYWTVFGREFQETFHKLDLKYPLTIEFTFVRSTLQEVDYTGPLESAQDIMQDFNWIPNDDYKHLKPVLGDMQVDKQNPGVKIKILLK